MSYTVCFKLKAVDLAEASNRNAGKELGINENLCGIEDGVKSNFQEQCDLYSVKNLNTFFFTKVWGATYTPVNTVL